MTRAVGILLFIPMVMARIRTGEWMELEWRSMFNQRRTLKAVIKGLLTLSPLIAFVTWQFSYLGMAFDYIQSNFFRRGFLSLGFAFSAWFESFHSMLT